MAFSSLTLTDDHQVTLLEHHVTRLGNGSREALVTFAQNSEPGVYRVEWNGTALQVVNRGPSRLFDGMPVRFHVSPFAGRQGRHAKPGSPSPYDTVRVDGVTTVLTSPDGSEFYESCRACLVAWDGASVVLAPLEIPAVASVAEAALMERSRFRRAPLRRADPWPLLLINAVIGTCAPAFEGRPPFPAGVRKELQRALSTP